MNYEIIADVTGQKLYNNKGNRVIDTIKAHTPVEILEANQRPFNAGTWTKVRTVGGQVGWVAADHVQRIA